MTQQMTKPIELSIIRSFRAPRERVFAMFTSIENLKRWFGPEPCQTTGGEMDFREGGQYRCRMQTPMGAVFIQGKFTAIRPHEHLAYTFQWDGHEEMNSDVMQVTFDLSEGADGGTILRMNHSGFETIESRDNHHDGWNGTFDRLLLELRSEAAVVIPELEARTQSWDDALLQKDLDAVTSHYVDNVRLFDIGSITGDVNGLRQIWEACFPYFPDPIHTLRKDIQWTVSGEMAVMTCLSRMTGHNCESDLARSWLRATICLKKVDGIWQVFHEHISVPVDCEKEQVSFIHD
ncbi:MAG: SRPBCC domain-containing protein [Opitutales bacterium]